MFFAENVAPDNIVNVLNNSEVTNKLNFVSKTDIDNFVTSADVTTTVNTALANYATTENVNTTVNNALASYTTEQKLKDTLAVYAKLTDIPAEANLSAYATTESVTEALDNYTPTADLAAVATTGSYSDLTGTPTIPTKVSDLTDASNYLTTAVANNTYAKPADVTNTVNTALASVNASVSNTSEQIVRMSSFIVGAAEGAVAFSVSADQQVYFSKGNLPYQASTHSWRFAEHQYDAIGFGNDQISTTYSGWIDLFGWGTGDNPTNIKTNSDYYPTFTDWGTNAISNGGNNANQWRTLSREEWLYIINNRTNAANLIGKATVANVFGVILLPDEWTLPNGLSFVSGTYPQTYATNNYTADQWALMEAAGAVFLPVTGLRDAGTVMDFSQKDNGFYWTTKGTEKGQYQSHLGAYYVRFTETGSFTDFNDQRYRSKAVRLVLAQNSTNSAMGVQNAQNAQNAVNAQNFGDMPLATVNLTIKSGSSGCAAGAGAVKFMGKEWSITTSSSPIEQTYKLPAYSPIIIYIKADKLNSYSSYSVSVKINGEGIDVTQLYGNQYIIGPFDPTRVNTLEIAFYTSN